MSIDVSKTEETVSNKRILNSVTKKTFASAELDSSEEGSIAVYNDRILLIGKKDGISQALNQTGSGGQNERMSRLISMSPNSLIAFAVNTHNLDLVQTSDLFAEQRNVWQIYGGVTAISKEVTMTINIEKNDIQPSTPQQANETKSTNNGKIRVPLVEENSAIVDLFQVLAKTIVGAEGKFTLKFEKRKIAQIITETPNLLSNILSSEFSNQKTRVNTR